MSSRSWSNDEKLRAAGAVAGVLVVAAAVGLGLYAFRPDLLPSLVTDWLSSHLSSGQVRRVAVRLAVLAGLIVVAVVVVGMFRRRRLAFAEELIGELPASYEPARHCHPSRYRAGIPQRVHLTLPPGFAVNGSDARAKLTKAMSDRMGGQVKVSWHAGSFLSRPSATFSRTARTAVAEAHEQGQDRVLELAADAMGVKGDYRITNVKEWGGATGAEPVTFKLHYPRSIKFNDPINQRRTEQALGTNLGVRLRGDWDLTREEVFLKKRPPMPGADGDPVLHPGVALIKKTAPHLLPVGVNEDSETVYWDTKKDPHGLGVGPTNSGKALDCDTPIATPAGWTTMGALKVGDYVFDETGTPTRVRGIYDQPPNRPCYEVVFTDGAKIVADADHLWWTEDRETRIRRGRQAKPRPDRTRIPQPVIDQAEAVASISKPAERITLPEVARLLGLSPTNESLHAAAKKVGPRGVQIEDRSYHYPAQTVIQDSDVRVYAASEARATLIARATAGRSRIIDADKVASLPTTGALATRDLAEQLGVNRGNIGSWLADCTSWIETRSTRLTVKSKTVTRPGPATNLYSKTALLRALADIGRQWGHLQRRAHMAGQTRTTAEIRDTLITTSGHRNHSIPVTQPLNLPAVDLPIAPYTLGCWLGDGSSWNSQITSADPEVGDLIRTDGYQVQRLPHSQAATCPVYSITGLRHHLRSLGLLRTTKTPAAVKHIPSRYLRASISQRRELLAGLLDTDGTVSKQGQIEFTSISHPLAAGVLELALSLGYRAVIRQRRTRLNGMDCGPAWLVAFTTSEPVFRLTRKRQAHQDRSHRQYTARTGQRTIRDVRPVPSRPVRCIEVESPSHLFLAGREMIPTHNTVTVRSAIIAALIKKWEVYICDPKRVEFSGFRHGWGVKSIAVEDKDMADLIVRIREQIMDVRYAEGEAKLNRGEDPEWDKYPPILVVLDEFTELVLAVGDLNKAKGMSGTPKAVDAVGRLGRLARLCNIHLIVLAQRPDAEKQFPGGARDQLTFRYSMTGLSPQSALMQWNNSDWGRYLPAIKGRGMCGVYGTEPKEVQFFWTPDPLFPKGEKDTALRDQLRAECQKVQANVPASIEGADYDLGPVGPSPEGTLDGLMPDFDRVELIALPGEVTAETIKVPAETLIRGDRIIRGDAVFHVDRVEGDDDPMKIVIRSIRPAARDRQTITCRATESLNRLESVPGVDLPAVEDEANVAPRVGEETTALAESLPSKQQITTVPVGRGGGSDDDSDSAHAWLAARAALNQAPVDQAPVDQAPVDDVGGVLEESGATELAGDDRRLRVAELEPGQQIIRKNRKGLRVTYTVESATLVSGQVKLTLKPARGQNRVEALPPDTLVERGDLPERI